MVVSRDGETRVSLSLTSKMLLVARVVFVVAHSTVGIPTANQSMTKAACDQIMTWPVSMKGQACLSQLLGVWVA